MSVAPYLYSTSFSAASRHSVELGGWVPSSKSADAAMLPERDITDARLRDLERNSGWVYGATTRLLDNVVGASMRPQIRPDWKALGITKDQAREFSIRAEAAWRTYTLDPGNYCDASRWSNFGGLVRQLYWHRIVDGREAVMPLWLPRYGARSGTAFQVIDPHRVSNPMGRPDSHVFRKGVELDRYGAPVAFHVRERHPGDMLMMNASANFRWERIPAFTRWGRRRFILGFERRQADQTMGRSVLLSTLKKIRMLENRDDYELQAAALQATWAAFIKSTLPSDALFKMLAEAPDGQEADGIEDYLTLQKEFHDQRNYTLNGARVGHLLPGEEFETVTARETGSNFTDGQRHWVRYFAQAIGMNYELASGDFSQSAYVGMRAGFNEVWKHIVSERELFASTTLTPMLDLWLEEEIASGRLELPAGAPSYDEARGAWCQVWWIGPGRGSIDPQKEANARRTEMETGFTTLEDTLAESGVDPEDHLDQLAYEEGLRMARGLPTILVSPRAPVAAPADEMTQEQPADDREGNNRDA